jgi:hypothetical protein
VTVFVCDHRSNTQDPMSSRFLVGLGWPMEVSPLHDQMAFPLAHSTEVMAMQEVLAARPTSALMERQVMEERCPRGRCLFPPR